MSRCRCHRSRTTTRSGEPGSPRIVTRVAALPGVEQAALTTTLPMAVTTGIINFNRTAQPPRGPADYVAAGFRAVTPDYLATLRVPLLSGRSLEPRDAGGLPEVVVINQSMASRFFAGRNPVGQRIQLGTIPSNETPIMRIVGIVGDVRKSFQSAAQPEMYVPYGADPDPVLLTMYLAPTLLARTSGDPSAAVAAVRAAIHEVDPAQPLVNVRTMDAALAGTVAQPHLQMVLLILFALLAVILAAMGVYGVMAYVVVQRIPEIGIRMAVGASRGRVVGLLVWEGARLAMIGIA
ncbi:MAG: ABC transporter permease, partial [Acidobacteriota bacterium]